MTPAEPVWSDRGVYEAGPGVHRIPLPLPGDGLKAVNVYAIEQPDGVVLIDSGWALGSAQDDLEAALATLDHDLGSIQRILVTHVHRDHYELGVHLKRLFGARLALGIGEQPSLEGLRNQPPPEESVMLARLIRAGADPLIERMRERRREHPSPKLEWDLPDDWLHGSDVIELDGRSLEVVATPGHTQGHVVFFDRASNVLFAGDHVLPHITPSIGFEQAPVDSALADYLQSLAIVRELPDARLLPAHGPIMPTTHDRIDELVAHHDARLELSHKAVAHGAVTGYEVARTLPWTRRERAFDDLDVFNQMLAVNETIAHLEVLVRRGDLTATDENGIRVYAD